MPRLTYDLTGKRFGRLLVSHHVGALANNPGRTYWECKCDCGKTYLADSFGLRYGSTKSCGCAKHKYTIGDKWGLYTLVRYQGNHWYGRCSCGTVNIVSPLRLSQTDNPMCVSCSGEHKLRKDLKGMVFGKLTALESTGTDKHRNAIWKLRCQCGNEIERRINEVQRVRKKPQSCGACP